MARKSNKAATEIDKTSYFFTKNCGVCHPGDGPTKYDRDGQPYWDGAQFGYQRLGKTLADVLTPGVNIDGDYALVNASGAAIAAPWDRTGVSEADCLMCHMSGYSWKKRAAVQSAGETLVYTGTTTPAPAFAIAPTAGANLATLVCVGDPTGGEGTCNPATGKPHPVATSVALALGSGVVPAASIVAAPPDPNCRGCHTVPDRKKSGRSFGDPATDVHVVSASFEGLSCTDCHQAGSYALSELIGQRGMHEIAKGDITIGSVRNDLDGTATSCADCHLLGVRVTRPGGTQTPLAPDPAPLHAAIPPFHFERIGCNACHVRYLQDSESTPTVKEVPEVFIDAATTGTQVSTYSDQILKTDPLDPSRHLPELTTAAQQTRWYPGIRPHAGKLTSVKPLLTAWFGDWLDGFGDTARVRPVALRLVRKMLAGVTLHDGDGMVNTRAEIKAYLERLSNPAIATDGVNAIFSGRPVLVRAGKVWFLDALGQVGFFESAVAESHDFGVNHNVVRLRDPANTVVQPGPWGSAGCAECHSPASAFFFGKVLADPKDENGNPVYRSRWQEMGYDAAYVAAITASVPQSGATGPAGPAGPQGAAGSSGCGSAGGAGTLGVVGLALAAVRRRKRG